MKKKWGFVTCGPNQVLVVSGCCHSKPSISVGGRVFVCPLIQKLQILTLNILTVTLETINTHSHHGIPVTVRGTAQVKIENTKESLRKSCELFLGMVEKDLISFFRELIEGHQRDIIGKMDIQDIYYRQDVFCKKLLENCQSKLQEMGLVLLSYNVNQVEDTSGCIKDYMNHLQANNLKNLRIQQAETRRDSIIETILTESEMKLRQSELKMEIVQQERDLMVKKLDNDSESSKMEAVKEMTSLLEGVRNVGKVRMSNLEGDELRSELLLEIEKMNLEKERSKLAQEMMEVDSHEQSSDRMTQAHLKVIKDSAETEAGLVQVLAKTHSHLTRLATSTEHDLMMMTLPNKGKEDSEEGVMDRGDLLHDYYQITNTSSFISANGQCSLNKEASLSDIQPNLTQGTTMDCLEVVENSSVNNNDDLEKGMEGHESDSKLDGDEVNGLTDEDLMSLLLHDGSGQDKEKEFDNVSTFDIISLNETQLKVSQMIGLNLSEVIFAAVFEEVLEPFLFK